METQGSVRLFSWSRLSFILLLSGMMEVKSVEFYTVLNHTVLLSDRQCSVSDSDVVDWEKEGTRLAKMKEKKVTYYRDSESMYTLHKNGSLMLKRAKGETTKYTMKVYNSKGDNKCNKSMKVIVEDVLEQPLITYNCSSKDAFIVCSTNATNISKLTISWGLKSEVTTTEKSKTLKIKAQKIDVTCITKNQVSEGIATRMVNCEDFDIYLIVSIAGGSVALIIFIILVIYTVKYKPCRGHSSREDDVEVTAPPSNTLQRELPQPSVQSSGGYLNTDIQTAYSEHSAIQKPPEPGSCKGKQAKGRRHPPRAPGETVPMCESRPAPQHNRPPLPGNHPNDQAPRPQPRTKSKAPRQNRRNCQ